MRIVALIAVLTISGCHMMGQTAGCEPVASQNCQDGRCQNGTSLNGASACEEGCRTCSPVSWTSEFLHKVTFGCFGRHPKYARFEDNVLTRHDARKLACRELYANKCSTCVGADYRLGYEQAFVDISLGAAGDVPALPPANYWTNCSRTPGGHEKARQWFQGYADGAVAAKAIYEPYNKVAASQFYEGEWPDPERVTPTPASNWSAAPGSGYGASGY